MALFTRRILQQCIDDASTFASRKKLREWVKKLNSLDDRNYVATEWEIVLLRTLSTIGKLTHPEETPKQATVDVIFSSVDESLSFAADIAAISERGVRENHPVHQLHRELQNRFKALGFNRGGLTCRAEQLSVPSKGKRQEILLPKKEHFQSLIFNADFYSFVEQIRREPDIGHVYRIVHKNPRTVASIFYDPRNYGAASFSDYSYISTGVVDKNPLYSTLKDKAQQLKRAGHTGRRGIIVCDGGARLLTESRNWYSFCNEEVVQHFLRKHQSVDFVLTLGLEDHQTATFALRQKLVPQLFAIREEPWISDLAKLFDKMITLLPEFDQSPENAYSDLRHKTHTEHLVSHLGALSMSIDRDGMKEVRMSARTLLALLAGQVSQEQFLKRYSHENGIGIFESILRRGQLITHTSLNRLPDKDDDEIVFTFGKPDPAVAPFVTPQQSQKNSNI